MIPSFSGRFRCTGERASPEDGAGATNAMEDERLTLSVDAPALRTRWLRAGSRLLLILGEGPRGITENGPLDALADDLARDASAALNRLSDPFVLVYADSDACTCLLSTDRVGTRAPCYARTDAGIAFGLRTLDVERALQAKPDLDIQSVYDYLYFHVIPAPATILRNVSRLLPGHLVLADPQGVRTAAWWTPRYESHGSIEFKAAREELRERLRAAVSRYIEGQATGAYLSGGTDSSTIAGMLSRLSTTPVRTYSIGFDVAGYDEIGYAKIAAQHFGTQHCIRYVTPSDVLASVEVIGSGYDQPFGNSSAAAAYVCAQVAAADGMTTLLGGDGGDEIFGGNTRYAKQLVFGAYGQLPTALRSRVLEPLFLARGVREAPMIRKLSRYIEQARVRMPDRLETWNLLERIGARTMLTDPVLDAVDTAGPLRLQRDWYDRCEDSELVNRMLHFDWKFTLSDNDLPKVVGTADLAGVNVGFPLLDPDLVAFANGLPAHWKVRPSGLRWFFKRALADFLPTAVLRKKKHGFGLPFGDWVVTDPRLQRLARGSLEALRDRGLLRSRFLDDLLDPRLREHAGYFGELVWILMMLEIWLAAHRPAHRFG